LIIKFDRHKGEEYDHRRARALFL